MLGNAICAALCELGAVALAEAGPDAAGGAPSLES